MEFIRPVERKDLEALWEFANEVGYGFTTLPKDKKLIEEKIEKSLQSFSEKIEKPHHESYLFVLDREGVAIGCSGLVSRIGMSEPFYAYHLLPLKQESKRLNISQDVEMLHFITARKKPTELCTLFLKKQFRHSHYGRLLSLSRFLFIAAHRHRFAPIVIAELRGYSDPEGNTPFFDAIARPFFKISFNEANYLRYQYPECIEDLFPHHPLYVNLLPQDAQKSIGRIHPDTIPAMKLLEKQGFAKSHYFDIFDAGPHLFAHTEEINPVRNSQTATLTKIAPTDGQLHLLSNLQIGFRATVAPVQITENGMQINEETSKALQVREGDSIRYYPC